MNGPSDKSKSHQSNKSNVFFPAEYTGKLSPALLFLSGQSGSYFFCKSVIVSLYKESALFSQHLWIAPYTSKMFILTEVVSWFICIIYYVILEYSLVVCKQLYYFVYLTRLQVKFACIDSYLRTCRAYFHIKSLVLQKRI